MRVILPEDSPYDLERLMLRDGQPRDVLNQRIKINDTVRIWSVEDGWSSARYYFIRHVLPVWSPADPSTVAAQGPPYASALTFSDKPTQAIPKGDVIFFFLLAPTQDQIEQNNNASFSYLGEAAIEVGEDAIEITKDTTLLITAQDFLVIEEGLANNRIKAMVKDYQVVKIRAGETNVIYTSDSGATDPY
jgi:hypothetical protein